jgi:hypothetical protein
MFPKVLFFLVLYAGFGNKIEQAKKCQVMGHWNTLDKSKRARS